MSAIVLKHAPAPPAAPLISAPPAPPAPPARPSPPAPPLLPAARQRTRPGAAEFDAVGLGSEAALPPGWVLHADTGYYVHDELVIALFAHPGHMRAVTGAGPSGAPGPSAAPDSGESPVVAYARSAEGRAWLQTLPAEDINSARADARALEQMLPAEDSNFFPLLCAMVEKSTDYSDFMERVHAGRRVFKKLVLTLDTSRGLFLAGDRVNAIRFREKVPSLIPECVRLADSLFEQEKYAEAAEHLRVAAVVYIHAGRRFRMALGQILDRLSFCYFMERRLHEAVRTAEHALYILATSGVEVEWALVTVVRNMGKYYRTMDLTRVALLCFDFCLQSARETEYMCVAEKQMCVIDSYDTGALLWMPETDEMFIAELTMLVGLCLMALDRRESALELCSKAFDLYQMCSDSPRPIQSYLIMTISCYNHGLYKECIKYADAVWELSFKLQLCKVQSVALFYCAHATAMCGCHVQAIDMFRLLETMPALTDADRSGIPAKLMFADCLKQEKHYAEAVVLLEDAARALLPGAELFCHYILLAACHVETRDLPAARKYAEMAFGDVPRSFSRVRDYVNERLAELTSELEDKALSASRDLCPDFEPGARGARGARARRAAARAARAERAAQQAAQQAAGPTDLIDGSERDGEAPEPPECCVCLAAPATVAFSPCFHRCVCLACSAGVMGAGRECPLCRGASDAAHEILDVAGACARCGAAPRTCAAAPCFHMQFCDECARAEAGARPCAVCACAVEHTHRVFA